MCGAVDRTLELARPLASHLPHSGTLLTFSNCPSDARKFAACNRSLFARSSVRIHPFVRHFVWAGNDFPSLLRPPFLRPSLQLSLSVRPSADARIRALSSRPHSSSVRRRRSVGVTTRARAHTHTTAAWLAPDTYLKQIDPSTCTLLIRMLVARKMLMHKCFALLQLLASWMSWHPSAALTDGNSFQATQPRCQAGPAGRQLEGVINTVMAKIVAPIWHSTIAIYCLITYTFAGGITSLFMAKMPLLS